MSRSQALESIREWGAWKIFYSFSHFSHSSSLQKTKFSTLAPYLRHVLFFTFHLPFCLFYKVGVRSPRPKRMGALISPTVFDTYGHNKHNWPPDPLHESILQNSIDAVNHFSCCDIINLLNSEWNMYKRRKPPAGIRVASYSGIYC